MDNILEFLKCKKNLCIFITLSLLTGTFFTLYMIEATAEESFSCPNKETLEKDTLEEVIYIIDIKGAVNNPGVYRVKEGTIIQDALTLAGGIRNDADTSNLNLSKKVTNEMVITVFTKEEIKKLETEKEPIKEEVNNEKNDNNEATTTKLISLNTATLEELTTIPGIGESKAKLIIEYRETCGKFTKKEEIKNIKGIGDALYEKMESYITV